MYSSYNGERLHKTGGLYEEVKTGSNGCTHLEKTAHYIVTA